MSVCDVAPLSKRVDTFCLSSGKAKNILIILLILSNKLPLRLCNGGRWQLVNLKPEYDEYYIKTRSFFLDLPDHPAMEERDTDGNLLSDGERLTRLGRFLRKTSMDPQITQIFAD